MTLGDVINHLKSYREPRKNLEKKVLYALENAYYGVAVSTRQPLQNRDKSFGLGENRNLGTSIGALKEKKFGFE